MTDQPSLSIVLDRPDYLGGEVISGNVVLITTKEIEYTTITLHFVATETTQWAEIRASHQHGDDHSRMEEHKETLNFINKFVELGAGSQRDKLLPPGMHSFPFKLSLPLSAPRSIVHSFYEIDYEIATTMCYGDYGSEQYTAKKKVPVLGGTNPDSMEMVAAPPKQIANKTFSFTSGCVTVEASLFKSWFFVGEEVMIIVKVKNPTRKSVSSMQVKLKKAVKLCANGATTSARETAAEKTFEHTIPAHTNTTKELIFPLDAALVPSIIGSNVMLNYEIKLFVRFPWSFPCQIQFPIAIIPRPRPLSLNLDDELSPSAPTQDPVQLMFAAESEEKKEGMRGSFFEAPLDDDDENAASEEREEGEEEDKEEGGGGGGEGGTERQKEKEEKEDDGKGEKEVQKDLTWSGSISTEEEETKTDRISIETVIGSSPLLPLSPMPGLFSAFRNEEEEKGRRSPTPPMEAVELTVEELSRPTTPAIGNEEKVEETKEEKEEGEGPSSTTTSSSSSASSYSTSTSASSTSGGGGGGTPPPSSSFGTSSAPQGHQVSGNTSITAALRCFENGTYTVSSKEVTLPTPERPDGFSLQIRDNYLQADKSTAIDDDEWTLL